MVALEAAWIGVRAVWDLGWAESVAVGIAIAVVLAIAMRVPLRYIGRRLPEAPVARSDDADRTIDR